MLNWFKRKTTTVQASLHPDTLFKLQAGLLADRLKQEGMEVVLTEESIIIPEKAIEILCKVVDLKKHDGGMVVYQLVFAMKINGSMTHFENMAAFGTDPSVAFSDAINSFYDVFFRGFLNSVAGYHEPQYEIITKGGRKFHLLYSLLQVQGAFKDDPNMDDTAFIKVLFPVLQSVFDLYEDLPSYTFEDYYLIKIYLSRSLNGEFVGECLFNNGFWQFGLDALLEQDYATWKATNQFLAKKQFIFIKQCLS